MSCDLNEFSLEILISRVEYIRIHSKYSPPDIRELYHIEGLVAVDGYVYIQIMKGIYGLKKSALISYNKLISYMDPHSYYPVPFTTGLWEHNTRRKNLAYVWIILE